MVGDIRIKSFKPLFPHHPWNNLIIQVADVSANRNSNLFQEKIVRSHATYQFRYFFVRKTFLFKIACNIIF